MKNGGRILFVSSDRPLRTLLRVSLATDRVPPICAPSADQAIERLLAAPFDAIITDSTLPDMEALEFVQRVRAIEKHRETPVIFLTDHMDREAVAEAARLKIAGVFLKPVPVPKLNALLKELFAHKKPAAMEPESHRA